MVRLVRLQAPVAFGDPALHASAGSWHLRCHLRFEASGRACGVNLSLSGLVSEVGLLRDVSNAKDRIASKSISDPTACSTLHQSISAASFS